MKSLLFVLFVLAACDKGQSLEKLQRDGFQCGREGGGVGFVAKENQHCFVCASDDAMQKCGLNPLTSGCREEPCKK